MRILGVVGVMVEGEGNFIRAIAMRFVWWMDERRAILSMK